ncbi:MAG: inositol monophosphatase [Paenibacillaceae bacterium]|nr:inositol monophosphatase [Paenibacillaceae bacterium]
MNGEQEAIIGGKSFTAVAVSVAAKAGEWIRSRRGKVQDMQPKRTWHDVVTDVDRGAEALIAKLIATYFPTHAFYGEESANDVISDAEYVWIVDPIDGTTNFVHGLGGFVTSVALAHRGEIIVGVVYDIVRDVLYVAERGKGAYVHGKRIFVCEQQTLQQTLVACGFPVEHNHALPRALRQLNAIAPHVRNVRAYGSAALHLAYVAEGKLGAYWEPDLKLWDVAAGVLLVQEAGGKVTDCTGAAYHIGTRDVLATNGHVHGDFVRHLGRIP